MVKTMRNFTSPTPRVEFPAVTHGEDYMVKNGLQLHVPPARLSAVIPFALRRRLGVLPADKTILNLPEPAKIVAGGREIVLMQKLADGEEFAMFDARTAMNAGLQFFDESFRVPLMLFGRHFPRYLSA